MGQRAGGRAATSARRRWSTASTTSCCARSAISSRPTSTRSTSTTRTSTCARASSCATSCPARSTSCAAIAASSRSSRRSTSRVADRDRSSNAACRCRSGGSIVIDGTEALTAIDVNSGGSVRGPNPEETAFRTNLEAAAEIARQLRLRDIGGLIVVDFIDMRDSRHIQEVEQALRDAMKPDKARHEIGRISRLGLLEISRQRMRPAAMATTYTACPMCEGHGAVRTTESAALVALRKIHNRVSLGDVAEPARGPAAAAWRSISSTRSATTSRASSSATTARIQIELQRQPDAASGRDRGAASGSPRRPPTPAVAPGTVAEADRPAAASNGNGAPRRATRRSAAAADASAAPACAPRPPSAIALATLGGAEPAAYEGEVASVNGHAPTAEEPTGPDGDTIRETAGEASTEAAPSARARRRQRDRRAERRGRRGGRGRRVGGDRARRDVAHASNGQSATPPTRGNADGNDRRSTAPHAAPEPPTPVVQVPRRARAARPRPPHPRRPSARAAPPSRARGRRAPARPQPRPPPTATRPRRRGQTPRRRSDRGERRPSSASPRPTPRKPAVAPTRPRRAPRRKPTAEA